MPTVARFSATVGVFLPSLCEGFALHGKDGGKMQEKLSAKEALFCEYCKILGSPREAAARAGYPFPEKSGMKLLRKKRIKRALEESVETPTVTALEGLRRIAFGSVCDAVYLCTCGQTISRETLETLDLFSVSELKFTKSGGIEVKFFDRLKALDLLSSASVNVASDSAEPFYLALAEGAKNLKKAVSEDGI